LTGPVSWCSRIGNISIVAKLLILLVWSFVTLHAIQCVLRMALAVAEQDITADDVGSELSQDSLDLTF
jgi:hypothetical protein